ncbi:ribonuclease J [Vineibacter terrae]|uniref:Ribonuclease J n=1 Tax=Vineibacter terrae TaxID=2586908 RepID=A0A5C8PP16_9HYPH|nr:ribonuclease J [Vineibacter terrae]TXL76697.1 ribonuclease J [Vineibacter terrae]
MTTPGDELLFLPLGGAGEIGMNLNLYGCRGKWLMLDLGVTFADESTPGLDVLMPDPAFIVERKDDLVGIVLTHAHEDHLGAVPDLWPLLRCPVYATPFAASVLARKLHEAGLQDEVPVTVIPLGGSLSLPPFELEFVTMTHSIPEPNAVAIRTPHGVVLHTGDWKIDPEPLIGDVTDEAALRRLGTDGVLAMVCDSTNVFVPGEAGSEAEVRDKLVEVIRHRAGLVAVTCFASNLARVESVAKAAVAADRQPVLVGRALHRMVEAAQENGYLTDFPATVAERDAGWLPRDKVCLICTGSQGEPRAALARLASGDNRDIGLQAGDTVVFSSRVIPGNEKSIGRLQNQLAVLGVEIVTDRDADIHVSGHPARDELTRLYQWVRPRIAVPVHGERRHMVEHAALAQACQVPTAIVAPNGSLVRLAPGTAEVIDHVPTGRLARDGTRLVAVDDMGLRDRRKMLWNGAAVAMLVLDRTGRLLAAPKLTVQGLAGDAATVDEALAAGVDALRASVADLSDSEARDDSTVAEAARRAVRRVFKSRFDKKPLTDVQVVRI